MLKPFQNCSLATHTEFFCVSPDFYNIQAELGYAATLNMEFYTGLTLDGLQKYDYNESMATKTYQFVKSMKAVTRFLATGQLLKCEAS